MVNTLQFSPKTDSKISDLPNHFATRVKKREKLQVLYEPMMRGERERYVMSDDVQNEE